jgi:hypothetical protein
MSKEQNKKAFILPIGTKKAVKPLGHYRFFYS